MRNALALALLMLAIYLPDVYAVRTRPGWTAWSPYGFLLLLYGWLVFHNRILFERLFERGKRREYAGWMLLGLAVGTLNMTLILRYGFGVHWPMAILVKFYVFTVAGLGVYVIYRQLSKPDTVPLMLANAPLPETPLPFVFTVDGNRRELKTDGIVYLESLENYVRVITPTATLLTRMTMRQAEEQLPGSFLRISRSHLINKRWVTRYQGNEVMLNDQCLRIGRTYKQHVAGQLRLQPTTPDH